MKKTKQTKYQKTLNEILGRVTSISLRTLEIQKRLNEVQINYWTPEQQISTVADLSKATATTINKLKKASKKR